MTKSYKSEITPQANPAKASKKKKKDFKYITIRKQIIPPVE